MQYSTNDSLFAVDFVETAFDVLLNPRHEKKLEKGGVVQNCEEKEAEQEIRGHQNDIQRDE
jgi:hypothetical protein